MFFFLQIQIELCIRVYFISVDQLHTIATRQAYVGNSDIYPRCKSCAIIVIVTECSWAAALHEAVIETRALKVHVKLPSLRICHSPWVRQIAWDSASVMGQGHRDNIFAISCRGTLELVENHNNTVAVSYRIVQASGSCKIFFLSFLFCVSLLVGISAIMLREWLIWSPWMMFTYLRMG